jgi:hypothetical protein
MEALATAAGIPLVEPVRVPVAGLSLRGIRPIAAPVSDNVASGRASAGLLQFEGGHFVAFDDDLARPFVRGFFRSIAEGSPSIGQPAD